VDIVGVVVTSLVPLWTIISFALGVTMERGTFGLWPTRRRTRNDLVRELAVREEQVEDLFRQTNHWRRIAERYQAVYPEPPREFECVIQEESDSVAPSMSH
jgi:hypothetical protein